MIDKNNSWNTNVRLKEGDLPDTRGFLDLLTGGGLRVTIYKGDKRGVGFIGNEDVKQLYEVLKKKYGEGN